MNEKTEVYLEDNGKVAFEPDGHLIQEKIQEELKKIIKSPEKYFKTSDKKALNLTIEMIKHLFSYSENDNFQITDAYIIAKIRDWFESFLERELPANLSDVQKEIENLSEEKLYQIAKRIQYDYSFFDIAEAFSLSPLTIKELMKKWGVSFYRELLTFEGDPTFRKKKLSDDDVEFLEDWTYQDFIDSNDKPLSIESIASVTLFSEKTITQYLSKIGCNIENNMILSIDPIKSKRIITPEEYFSLRILTGTYTANIFIHHNNYSRSIQISDLKAEDYTFLNEKLNEIEQHLHDREKIRKDVWRDR